MRGRFSSLCRAFPRRVCVSCSPFHRLASRNSGRGSEERLSRGATAPATQAARLATTAHTRISQLIEHTAPLSFCRHAATVAASANTQRSYNRLRRFESHWSLPCTGTPLADFAEHMRTSPSASSGGGASLSPSAASSAVLPASSVHATTRQLMLGAVLMLLAIVAHVAWTQHHAHEFEAMASRGHISGWRQMHLERMREAARESTGLQHVSHLVSVQARADAAGAAAFRAALLEGQSTPERQREAAIAAVIRLSEEVRALGHGTEEALRAASELASTSEAAVSFSRPLVDRFPQSPVVQRRRGLTEALMQDPQAPVRILSKAALAEELSIKDLEKASWQASMAQARTKLGGPMSSRARMQADGAAAYIKGAARVQRLQDRALLSTPKSARPHPLVGPVASAWYASRTLILYLFLPRDQESLDNLHFFVQTAVRAHHTSADYVILVQNNPRRPVAEEHLPILPANARYIHYESPIAPNECGGLGAIGWLVGIQHPIGAEPASVSSLTDPRFVAVGHYKQTMIIDSSMRGPWFPTWVDLEHPDRVWYAAFEFHLEQHAAITGLAVVGSTMSCQYGQPHVQQGAMMLSKAAWDVLDSHLSEIASCVDERLETLVPQSMLFSRRMLEAGLNLGSQMLAFQGLDFRWHAGAEGGDRIAFEVRNQPAQSCLTLAAGVDPQLDELSATPTPSTTGTDASGAPSSSPYTSTAPLPSPLGEPHFMDPYEVVFTKYTAEFKGAKAELYTDWLHWERARRESYRNRTEGSAGAEYNHRWTASEFKAKEEAFLAESERRWAAEAQAPVEPLNLWTERLTSPEEREREKAERDAAERERRKKMFEGV